MGLNEEAIVLIKANHAEYMRALREMDSANKKWQQDTAGVVGKVSKSFEMQGKALASLRSVALQAAGAFGIGVGVGGLTAAFKSASDEAKNDELAFQRIDSQLISFGNDSVETRDRIVDLVGDLEEMSGIADDAIFPAFQRVLAITGDVNVAIGAMPRVLDMVSSGMFDAEQAARLWAAAHEGNITMLTRFLPQLREKVAALGEDATATDRARVAMEELDRVFSGQAARNADTYAGRIEQMKRAMDDLKGAIGAVMNEAARPEIERLTQFLKDVAEGLKYGPGGERAALTQANPPRRYEGVGDIRLMDEAAAQQRAWNDKLKEFRDALQKGVDHFKMWGPTAEDLGGILRPDLGTVPAGGVPFLPVRGGALPPLPLPGEPYNPIFGGKTGAVEAELERKRLDRLEQQKKDQDALVDHFGSRFSDAIGDAIFSNRGNFAEIAAEFGKEIIEEVGRSLIRVGVTKLLAAVV